MWLFTQRHRLHQRRNQDKRDQDGGDPVSRSLGTTPSGISVHIRGTIDGSAYVYLPEWGSNKLSGNVDWERYGDWFSTNCDLYYFPDQVRSGSLKVRYTFH